MSYSDYHFRQRPTPHAQARSRTMSRRSICSFFSVGSLVGFCAPFARGLTANQGLHESQKIEVVHTHVFAAGPHGGNPCPVVLSADQLDVRTMQAVSARFGQDTVFILAPHSNDADLRLRFFVPEHEMGVSGHATIAAITVAVRDGKLQSDRVRVETLNGTFVVTCVIEGQQLLVTLEQNRPVFGPQIPASRVATALNVRAEDIADSTPIQSVSVSRPKLLLPIRNSNALNALKPNFDVLWSLCDSLGVTGLYPFTVKTDKRSTDAEARQFPLRAGFPEDAATGVAAAALGSYLVQYGNKLRTGEHRFRIAQGYAMGAPSLIEALIDCESGNITRTAILGKADIIHREEISLV